MALQTSGPIALFLEIRAEEIVKTPSLSATDFGLREVSAAAGFTEPDLMSEFYGYSSVTPIVWTAIPVEVSKNDVSINVKQNANTYDQGNGTITSKGFYYGTSTNINSATRVQVNTSNNTAEFSRNFTGLSGGTTYRFWAFAVNDVGETVSGMRSISTLPTVPVSTVASWSGGIYANGNPWVNNANYSGYLNAWGNATSNSCYQHPYYGLTCPDSKSIGVSVLWQFAGSLNYVSTFSSRRANNTTTTNRRNLQFYAWCGGDIYGGGSATSWQPYHLRGNNTYISNMNNQSTYYTNNGCGGSAFRDYGNGYNNDLGSCIYHNSINFYDIDWYMQGGGSTAYVSNFGRVTQEFNSASGIYYTQ